MLFLSVRPSRVVRRDSRISDSFLFAVFPPPSRLFVILSFPKAGYNVCDMFSPRDGREARTGRMGQDGRAGRIESTVSFVMCFRCFPSSKPVIIVAIFSASRDPLTLRVMGGTGRSVCKPPSKSCPAPPQIQHTA